MVRKGSSAIVLIAILVVAAVGIVSMFSELPSGPTGRVSEPEAYFVQCHANHGTCKEDACGPDQTEIGKNLCKANFAPYCCMSNDRCPGSIGCFNDADCGGDTAVWCSDNCCKSRRTLICHKYPATDPNTGAPLGGYALMQVIIAEKIVGPNPPKTFGGHNIHTGDIIPAPEACKYKEPPFLDNSCCTETTTTTTTTTTSTVMATTTSTATPTTTSTVMATTTSTATPTTTSTVMASTTSTTNP